MNNYSEVIHSLSYEYDEKTKKKLKVDLFSRLCKKLEEESHPEVDQLLRETYELLRSYQKEDKRFPREYNKTLSILRKKVKEVYGYTAKDELKEQYTGIGIAIGVAMGAPFSAINPAFVGIGLPIGLAIGVAIGQQKEKEAEERNKTY